MNIAVLASGSGTNFEAVAQSIESGYIKADLKVLITDNERAYVRERANKFGIKDIYINPAEFKTRDEFAKKITDILRKENIDLIVLAGFMRIIPACLVNEFKNKILNIHPALLPAFKGVDAIQRAFDYGVRVTGVTVHFVDEQTDHGPVILQEAIRIDPGETVEQLEKRIHQIEYRLFPQAIKLFTENKLKVVGRKVHIED